MIAIVVLAGSALVLALLFNRGSSSIAGRTVPRPAGDPGGNSSATDSYRPQPGEVLISLPADQSINAQLEYQTAVEQSDSSGSAMMRTTGTVQSNAYKEVPVLPITGGIVRGVRARLGDRVTRGTELVLLFSKDLAEAQSTFLKTSAELEEHHKHHRRTAELADIGAASREELDAATSRYKGAQAEVRMSREKLVLFGLNDAQINTLGETGQISSLVSVKSPATGTVISRSVNEGEVIETGKELFKVADLSSVWVIAQVYEADFGMARPGTLARITTPALPDRTFEGRIEYVDPQVDPQTRTAQARIEVNNAGERLKIGMFVDVDLGTAQMRRGSVGIAVPSGAVQYIGSRAVVYVATGEPGTFAQREVVVRPVDSSTVVISNGVVAGERVVTGGSFLLRAESLKIKPDQLSQSAASSQASPVESATMTKPAGKTQAVTIRLTEKGYEPASVTLREDMPVRLTFIRTVEETCGTEVAIPGFNIKRDLPLNKPVVVTLTPKQKGEIGFACGMNMLKGKLIVR